MDTTQSSPRGSLIAAGVLLAANVAIPLVFGDVYPFTSAPMFRDCPERCCNYRVFAPDGRELPADAWLVQRVYDGNPVGYGVGMRPPGVIEHRFGAVADQAAVREHIQRQLAQPQHAPHPYVEVVQEIIGPLGDGQRVGVVQTNRWRVANTSP